MNLFDKLLRSRAATTIFLLAAIGAQTPHAAYVFYTTANDSRFTAWLAAFALESAVLHFVLHGQRKVSYLFASVSVAMNLAYYRMHGVDIFALEGATAWLLAIAHLRRHVQPQGVEHVLRLFPCASAVQARHTQSAPSHVQSTQFL